MPMTDDRRRAYLERAGVTQEQIDETVGDLPIHEGTLQERGLSRDDAQSVRGVIRQILADATIISAKCCAVARAGEPGPNSSPTAGTWTSSSPTSTRCSTPAARSTRHRSSTPRSTEWCSSTGWGAPASRRRTSRCAYTATPRWSSATTNCGPRAGRGRPRRVRFEQDLKGLHRITNTYYYRNDRWQAAHSHMTRVPADRPWRFALNPDV